MNEKIDIEDLVDLRTVKIDKNLPAEEQYLEFVRQIKNPYYYKYKNHIVKLNYEGLCPSFDDLLQKIRQGEDFVQIAAGYIKQLCLKDGYSGRRYTFNERLEIMTYKDILDKELEYTTSNSEK